MSEIKIDKNIPFCGNASQRYPFEEMEVGDSFLVAPTTRDAINGSVAYWSMKLGRKFKTRTRTQEKHGEAGVRVWRIA